MIKYYKNTTGNTISLDLLGIGRVTVMRNAEGVPLDEPIAKMINSMVFPVVALEEVDPPTGRGNKNANTRGKSDLSSTDNSNHD